MATPSEGFKVFKRKDFDFEKKKYIGGGGFGNVHLVRHKQLGIDVAVKELKDINPSDRDYEMITKEANRLSTVINCSAFVNVLGIIKDRSRNLSIVMEFVEYGDLQKFNRKYMMSNDCWARKIKMIHEIALGMYFLHSQNPPVFHRDLKLENVFVGKGFTVKIGDLGLSISTKTVQNLKTVSRAGTLSHFPPEGFSSECIPDEFWDIWTFAITIFELISGEDPWPPHANAELIKLWLKNQRPNKKKIPKGTPPKIIELMENCWAGKQTERLKFKDILTSIPVSSRSEIAKADMAILGRISDSSEESQGKSTDSMDSAWGSLETMKISGDQKKSAAAVSKDSGMHGSSSQAGVSRDAEWQQILEFGKEGDEEGKLRMATGIAVCSTGDIAVVNHITANDRKVCLFSKGGEYKRTFNSTNPAGKLLFPQKVAVTSNNHVAITDQSSDVKIFDVNGSFVKSFSTLAPGEKPVPRVNAFAMGITVSNEDEIIVGDWDRKCITIHTPSGAYINKLPVPIIPVYLAANSNVIIISDWRARKVIGMTREGRVAYTIDRLIVDGKVGLPQGIACDNDDVYIAVKRTGESTGATIANSGHIHRYDVNGAFTRCIIRDLFSPYGLNISNSQLFIANQNSILVYGHE